MNSSRLRKKKYAVQEDELRKEEQFKVVERLQMKQQEVDDILNDKKHKEKMGLIKIKAITKLLKNKSKTKTNRIRQNREKFFVEVG